MMDIPILMLEPYGDCETWKCNRCEREFYNNDATQGCSDDMPGLCDDCWAVYNIGKDPSSPVVARCKSDTSDNR